jgi:hypothetical protein
MTQMARAVQDVSNSGWTPATVYSQINQPTPDDTTFVTSSNNPSGDAFTVKLAPLFVPDVGPETLTVRLKKTSTDSVLVLCVLSQNGKPIAGDSFQPTQSFANYTISLSDAEDLLITDYGKLRLSVTAGIATTTGCSQCPAAPMQWNLTVSGIQNGACSQCTGLNGYWMLKYRSGCSWSSDALSPCDPMGLNAWSLFNSPTGWVLSTETMVAGAGKVTWSLSNVAFKCLGVNTFSLDPLGSAVGCTNLPATLTIVPG